MRSFLWTLISLSLSGGFLTFLLAVLKPLYKNRFSKKWQYYIWLIVIARFMLPFTLSLPMEEDFALRIARYSDRLIQMEQKADNTDSTSSVNGTDGKADNINIPLANDPTVGVTNSTGTKETGIILPSFSDRTSYILKPLLYFCIWSQGISPLRGSPLGTSYILFLVWLTVAVAMLVKKITSYQSFMHYIRTGSVPIQNLDAWDKMGRLLCQEKIKTNISLFGNPAVSSPMLVGLIHPAIILPDAKILDGDFENTVRHEAVHYRRRDLIYKWLLQITVCLHWFNPLVYLMENEVNRLCELSCDEEAIKKLGKEEQREYGAALLRAAKAKGTLKDMPASISMSGNKKIMKERLDAIMKFKEKTPAAKICSAALAVVLAIAAVGAGNALLSFTSLSASTPDVSTNATKHSANMFQNMTAATTTRNFTDSYSKFTITLENKGAQVKLQNTSGRARHAQVHVNVYASDGTYIGSSKTAECNIEDGAAITSPSAPYGIYYEFYGYMYGNKSGAYGTPISSWHKALKRDD